MGDLEPITRNEKLWSGEDLTPVTRREMYIKHLYDETQVIPEYPVTREEMFILKAGEELHDVTIEQLTATENKTYSEEGVAYSPVIVNVPQTTLTTLDVTENGTYTAPSGTAYSEVDVDVPLPENAYLLKEIEDVEIASFNDGSDLPMPKLEVAIEPVQEGSGDPSPENIRPIIGWDEVNAGVSGVNVWDEEWEKGALSNSTGEPYLTSERVRSKNFILTKPTTAYYFCAPNTYSSIRVACYDKDKTYLGQSMGWLSVSNNTSFITPNNTYYIKFVVVKADETYDDDISINYPSTDTEYHAYNGQTITLDLDGTHYGGKVDLVSGVMTVDRVEKAMPANWSINAESSIYWLITHTTSDAISVENTDTSIRVISDGFKGVTADEILTQMTTTPNYVNCIAIISSKRLFLKVKKADYPTLNDLYSMIQTNNLRLVYELATPLTIQLSPTVVKSLRGMNNVYADTGNILDLSYLAKEE